MRAVSCSKQPKNACTNRFLAGSSGRSNQRGGSLRFSHLGPAESRQILRVPLTTALQRTRTTHVAI